MSSPSKLFTVIVEPKEGERGLTQRKVGMYSCEKCGTKFPTVVGRQHYLIVAEQQLGQIQTDIKDLRKANQELEKRVQSMDRDYSELQKRLDTTKKNSEMRTLETKLEALERHVTYLRKEKGELEEKTAKFR